MTKLSIIIVNYNGEGYLKACFDSIYYHCKGFSFEIIVVDNNSSDKSVSIIETEYPNIQLIKNKKNTGFAAANNTGAAQAKGDFILLLNNDTLLIENIKPAIDLLDSNQEIGIIGIKMLDGQNKFTASFGKFPKPYNFLKLKTLQINLSEINQKISNSQTEYVDVDWISGAFLLTTKEIWNQVNGLDESYFMYVEDVDFNKKVQALDKKSVFISSLRFTHYVGFNKNREKLLINSYKTYIRKHKRGFNKWLSLFFLNINLFYKKVFKQI
ncbi:MAG: hypothetical protein DRI74_01565 [Bacteroidetes bacterium]|nr:MAG: hypothetical protein DRI74_01565 [Bacteroidota bacterium]